MAQKIMRTLLSAMRWMWGGSAILMGLVGLSDSVLGGFLFVASGVLALPVVTEKIPSFGHKNKVIALLCASLFVLGTIRVGSTDTSEPMPIQPIAAEQAAAEQAAEQATAEQAAAEQAAAEQAAAEQAAAEQAAAEQAAAEQAAAEQNTQADESEDSSVLGALGSFAAEKAGEMWNQAKDTATSYAEGIASGNVSVAGMGGHPRGFTINKKVYSLDITTLDEILNDFTIVSSSSNGAIADIGGHVLFAANPSGELIGLQTKSNKITGYKGVKVGMHRKDMKNKLGEPSVTSYETDIWYFTADGNLLSGSSYDKFIALAQAEYIIEAVFEEKLLGNGKALELFIMNKTNLVDTASSYSDISANATQGTAHTSSGYIFPTDSKYITRSELSNYSQHDIMLIRNEIYARHGYNFQNEEVRNYFMAQSWYHPVEGVNASTFGPANMNECERTNLETITSYEKEMGWR